MASQAALKLVGKDDGDKQRALEAAIAQIDRAFGKGSVMKLGKAGMVNEIESVSTGSLGLDMALGIGGLPVGRVIEVFGPESSGKTTLALHTVAEVQKKGGVAAFVDAEHALDPVYAQKLGVNLDDLLCRSRTPASRRWRSWIRSSVRGRWTSWSSTPSPP